MGEDIVLRNQTSNEMILTVNSSNELLFTYTNGKTEILCTDVSGDFDAIAENNGTISVMIVALNGSLIFFRYIGGKWKKTIVLDSRSETKKINNIKLVRINAIMHAFYSLEYDGRMMLVHHISFNDDFLSKPEVIDYIGMRSMFSVSVDESYNIHIVYADEESQIKYTTFVNSSKSYSENKIDFEVKIRSINIVFFKNQLYGVYLSKERDYNVINCMRFSDGEKRTVGFGVDILSEPCIFSFGDALYVQWREKGYAFECSSGGDFKFTKPFSLGLSEKTLKLRSSSNETISFLDKCVSNIYQKPFPSAKNIFERLSENKKANFKIKGAEVEEFKNGNINSNEFNYETNRIYHIEEQLKNLIKTVEMIADVVLKKKKSFLAHDIGEIDEDNVKKFKNIDISDSVSTNDAEDEYIELEEE